MRYNVNVKAHRANVWERVFWMHLQSDSELEFTDLYTSLVLSEFPVALVLRCTDIVRRPTTSFCWCDGAAQWGVWVFRSMLEVFAARRQRRQIFSFIPFSLFFAAVAYSRENTWKVQWQPWRRRWNVWKPFMNVEVWVRRSFLSELQFPWVCRKCGTGSAWKGCGLFWMRGMRKVSTVWITFVVFFSASCV